MKPTSRSIAGLSLVFACCPIISLAQWPHRVDVDLLATDDTITASAPFVEADGNGGVFAVWNDDRNFATNNHDVFAQHYNANGIASWGENGVPVSTAANRQDDAIAVNAGNGSVYVVWLDERDSANNERVYAQLLNAQGVPQWPENGIRVGPNEFDQTDLVAVSDGDGNLLVAWVETTNNFRTFVQKIDNTGTLLWGASGFEFSSGVFGGASEFNVIPDGAGGAVLGWIEFRDNPRPVRAQRILANGTAAYNSVSFGTDFQVIASFIPMAPDGTGGAFLGWRVDDGTNDDLYIQRVDGDGMLPWGNSSKQLVDTNNVQDNLQTVSDDAGGAYLVWDDPRTGVDNVYIQHVDADGAFSFEENGMPVGVSAAQRFSARVIADGTGGAIVSFRFNQDGTFVQRIDIAGTRLWGDNGSQLTDNGTVNFPNLTSDGSNGAILGALAFTDGNRAALKRILASGDLPTSRLINISTRAFVGTGEAQAIAGFVISGSGSKPLVVRGIGPQLGIFGISVPLADPTLRLMDRDGFAFLSRDDWGSEADRDDVKAAFTSVGAFALPDDSKDAAFVADVAPGLYTAGVTGVGETEGVGLVEVYAADDLDAPNRIINLSSRVFAGTGENQAIAGFVIKGPATMTLLIRAVGPTLGVFGVSNTLQDPVLTLFDRNSAPITSNDDWGDGGSTQRNAIIAAAESVFAFSLDETSTDSVLLITLAPGLYTAGAVGADGGTGICLMELYVVP